VDALVEGLVMHRMLSTAPSTRDHTREAFRRALTSVPSTTDSTSNAPTAEGAA
jgi:hypothetical protein